jgi:unsaturated chondroitin disaccharide hydrolase
MRAQVDQIAAIARDGFPIMPIRGWMDAWTLTPAGDRTDSYWKEMLRLTAAARGDVRYTTCLA